MLIQTDAVFKKKLISPIFFTPDRVNVNRFETSCRHFILLSIQKTSQYYKESTVVVSPLNGIVRSFATGRCFDKYLRFLHPIEKMLTDLKCSRISRSNSTNSIDILLKLMHSKTIKSELIMLTRYRFTKLHTRPVKSCT